MAPKPDFDLPIDPKVKESIESRLEKIGLDTKHPKLELEGFMRWSENYDEGGVCRGLDALIESGYHRDNFWEVASIAKVVGKVSKAGPENYLKVFKNLKEKLSYDGVGTEVYNQEGQVDNLLQLARFKAFDVNMLAETGYTLTKIDGKNILTIQDVNIISKLMYADFRNYSEILKRFKEAAGCKGKFYYKACHAEDILTLSNTNGDVFGAIEALVKSGCKPMFHYNGILPQASLIKEIATKGPDRYLAVFTKLKEKLGYKNLNKCGNPYPYSNIKNIIQLLSIEGDVLKTFDVLAETNYKIYNSSDADVLLYHDIDFIKSLAKSDLEKFAKCYEFLKNRFGVSELNDDTADNLLRLLQMGDVALKVMDMLADSGYVLGKLGGKKWLSYDDVNLVRKLSETKSLETFLQNLTKLKETLGPMNKTIYLGGYGPLRRSEKIKYFASHAHEILQILEMKGDVWGATAALVKSGYEVNFSNKTLFNNVLLVGGLAKCDVKKYLDVFNKLREKFNYKTVNLEKECYDQVERLIKLSQVKGDVCKAIDALAESSYKLAKFGSKAWICYRDKDAIREVAISGPENYLKAFMKLKKKLGYNTIPLTKDWLNERAYDQVRRIIEISQILGSCKAIDAFAEWRNLDVDAYRKDMGLHAGGLKIDERKVDKLPPWGDLNLSHDFKNYKIDKKKGITQKDVEIIKYISDNLWEDCLNILTPCFYREPDSNLFIKCFESLSIEEKKAVLKGVFNCDKTNDPVIIAWLDKNYPDLVREVGLGLV